MAGGGASCWVSTGRATLAAGARIGLGPPYPVARHETKKSTDQDAKQSGNWRTRTDCTGNLVIEFRDSGSWWQEPEFEV
jgi:hypothetical protein